MYFAEDEKVGVATVKSLHQKMKSENAHRAIMIIHGKLSPFVRSALNNMEDQYRIEVFQEQELLVNITKHVLVPEHHVLSQQEKQDLLGEYKLKDNQLPRIQASSLLSFSVGIDWVMLWSVDRSSRSVLWHVPRRSGSDHTAQ